ncbi:MAG: glycoside hydrolase family 5 protein [Lachnospiraceae bacterium]|nr:glycoside hydrolase family 5 protein [Lachnospiraceae bacterium]
MRRKNLFTIAIAATFLLGACSGIMGTNGSNEVTTMPYGWTEANENTEITMTTPVPTGTPVFTPTVTATPTKKATATPTKKAAATPTKKATATPTKKAAATPTKKPTATPTPTPIKTSSVTPEWREMLKEMGTGWNLGNTMDAYNCTWLSNEMDYETAWVGTPKVSQKMIDTVAAAGFKTIRVPVSWHDHVTKTTKSDGSTYYKISEKWMKRVHEIVDYCINDDLFVILNIHHDDAGAYYVYPDAAHEKASLDYVTSVWEQIAKEFGDYDYHLIFETLNEPRLVGANEWNPTSYEAQQAQVYINRYNQAAVDTIRTTEGLYNDERYIGCPGYAASMDSLDKFVLPEDPSGIEGRIMVSVHAYTPYNFAIANIKDFNSSVKGDVDGVFTNLSNKLTKKNIPVYIGEWGVYAEKSNYDARLKYVDHYISSAASLKDASGKTIEIPTVVWDNASYGNEKENYGLLNRKTNKWYEDAYIRAIIDAGN